MAKVKLGVLVSGSGTNLQAILDAVSSGALDAEVSLVISNQPNGVSDVTTYWDNVSMTVGRVLPSILGDADLDGDVDGTDLGILALNWQQHNNWLGADFNGDGFVDVNDLSLLAGNWLAGVTSPSSMSFAEALQASGLNPSSVPEPATVTSIGFATLCLLRRRPRHRWRRTG